MPSNTLFMILPNGENYQAGVLPGPRKLEQFRECLAAQKTPGFYANQCGPAKEAIVHVKLFSPWSNWTWYVTEWNPEENLAFGYVDGHEGEFGYFSLEELAHLRGPVGLGVEVDMHFAPQSLAEALRETKGNLAEAADAPTAMSNLGR